MILRCTMRLCPGNLSNKSGRLTGFVLACLLAMAATHARAADSRILHLASLEWLPYVGAGLNEGGLSASIAAAAAKQFGYTLKIDYYPWKRTMEVGSTQAGFSGYFPAYYTEERARDCHFSAAMGSSTIGFAYLKDTPLKWEKLTDLAGIRIGVVTGYSNGSEFDALVKQGKLAVDASPSDIFNLRKLLAARVQAIVIDKAVLRYLLLTDPGLGSKRDQVVFHDQTLAELPLHVCFQRTAEGLMLQQAFNESLQHLDIKKIESNFYRQLKAQDRLDAR